MEHSLMKDSGVEWIGEIPENWNTNYLSQIFYQHKKTNSDMNETNLLSLSYGKIVRKDINSSDGLLPESYDSYNIIEPGDIILRLTDLQNDHKSLRVGRATEKGIVTSAYVSLRSKSLADSRYFYYLLHLFDIEKGFYGMGSGVRQGLNFDELKKIKIINPPHVEQTKIADYLDDNDRQIKSLIDNLNKQIESLKEYKKSLIYKCVTKGLDDSVPLKDSGVVWIGKIPENWIIEKVKFHTQYKSIKNDGTDLKFVALENVESFTSKFIETDNKYDTTESNIADKGDVMFGKLRPYLAKVYLCDEKICAGPGFAVFEPIDVESRYLKYYFINREFINYVNSFCHGTKMPAIDTDVLKNSPLVLPPFSEQVLIADYLDQKCKNIDDIILLEQQTIDKLNEYQKSLIYEYVTGKKEVV